MTINKNTNDYEEEDQSDLLSLFSKPKKIITRAVKQHEHYYTFDGYIETFEQYNDLIELLLTVPEGDIVRLYISSGGGRLDIADMIVSRIIEAQQRGVQVVAELGFTVASAATFIALHCDDLDLSPNTQFTIHPWSSGKPWGFATTQLNDALYDKKQSDRFMRDVYSGFLTEEELDSVLTYPRDIHYDAEEVLERWDNLQQYREKQYLDMIEEIKKQQEIESAPPKKKAPAKKTPK